MKTIHSSRNTPTVKQPHDYLFKKVTVREPGFACVFVSNEHPTYVDVYFACPATGGDDITITHTPGPLARVDDYYPFGLTFNSYSRENSVLNKWKFQGQEHVNDLGVNWDSFKWRNHQPDIGRFFNVDPLAEKYYYNSPYAFSENKVIAHVELEGLESWYAADGNVVHGPRSDKNIKELGLRSVQGASAHSGYVGVRTQQVRAEYNNKVSKLDPTDSKGRTQAKVDAREKLPALTREMSEKMRPIEGEATRTGGTANKTNAGVNSQAEAFGRAGKVALVVGIGVSAYNISTAEDKGQAIVKESGGWAGAIAGGEIGAELGSFGGPWGAAIGGVIGAIVGSTVGSAVAEDSISSPPIQNNYSPDGQYLVPKDAIDRIKIDVPIIRN